MICGTSDNTGHTATHRYAQIRQSRALYTHKRYMTFRPKTKGGEFICLKK